MIDKSWPTQSEIAEAHKFEHLGDIDASWSMFDLTMCGHVHRAETQVGAWTLSVCLACGDSYVLACEHVYGDVPDVKSTVELSECGTMYRCSVCGMDTT